MMSDCSQYWPNIQGSPFAHGWAAEPCFTRKQKISPLALPWTISLQKVDKQTHQFYRAALLMIA